MAALDTEQLKVAIKMFTPTIVTPTLTSIEICAGAGGQALGLEWAGFEHTALVEYEPVACQTLRLNRPSWNVIEADVRDVRGDHFEVEELDLLAGGVPCPPFSVAGLKLGQYDDRDLFPEAIRLVGELNPRAVMLENVRGLLAPEFEAYREDIRDRLRALGYPNPEWKLLNASDFGVPQLRPRAILIAMRQDCDNFQWPEPSGIPAPTVGEALLEEMKSNGWRGAEEWARKADQIAPTLVGGSVRHGGPDLGPTRARQAWLKLGVNGNTIAEEPPGPDYQGFPRLTVGMAATIQGFPKDWQIAGRKTKAYRQVGNAFPPPVAAAVANQIRSALEESFAVSLVSSVA